MNATQELEQIRTDIARLKSCTDPLMANAVKTAHLCAVYAGYGFLDPTRELVDGAVEALELRAAELQTRVCSHDFRPNGTDNEMCLLCGLIRDT